MLDLELRLRAAMSFTHVKQAKNASKAADDERQKGETIGAGLVDPRAQCGLSGPGQIQNGADKRLKQCAGPCDDAVEKTDSGATEDGRMVFLDEREAQNLSGAKQADEKAQAREGDRRQVGNIDQGAECGRLEHEPGEQRRPSPADAIGYPAKQRRAHAPADEHGGRQSSGRCARQPVGGFEKWHAP